MDPKKPALNPKKLSLKLSLKKETLRTLTDSEQNLLDGVVGGTNICKNSDADIGN
jgi:hypothetical protein